jgi:hypothetical protein
MKQTKTLLAFISLAIASQASGALILNEYNAVRADRWLDADGLAASTASDSNFGRIEGNGGRWFEMLVVGTTSAPGETVDLRGWQFDWTSTDVGSGSFTLSNDAGLASIHRGTLITFFSQDLGGPNVASNIGSYDPANGAWWLNVNLADATLVTSGSLDTGNGDWQVTVRDSTATVVFGPVGEGIGSFSGVSSREVGKLEAFTSATIADWQGVTPASVAYNDGTSSTFGSENAWSGGTNIQDFSALRVIPEPSTALLGGLGLLALLRRSRK